MTKNEYREFFAYCKQYIKLSAACKNAQIKQSNLTAFLRGYDYALSIEKLERIKRAITDICENIV